MCEIYVEDVIDFIQQANDTEMKKIVNALQEEQSVIPLKTLDDQFKMEIILKVWDKMSWYELEELLKHKL